MHINSIRVKNDIWCHFEILNVKSKDKKLEVEESVMAVAIFVRGGEELHRIYNLGNFDYCVKLLDSDFARSEAEQMINRANVSKHSPFRWLKKENKLNRLGVTR